MNKIFKFVYGFTIVLMILITIVLVLLISLKLDLNLMKITTYLPFENHFSEKFVKVSNDVTYIKLEEGIYHNGSNQVINIDDGIVEEVGVDYVIVKMDNECKVAYHNLSMVHVLKQDRVLKGVILGSYYDHIKITCYDQNGMEFAYEQY